MGIASKFFVVVLVVASLAGQVRAAAPTSYYVLAIGVGKYQDETVQTLPSGTDARKVIEPFTKMKEKAKIKTLTDADATIVGIKDALGAVKTEARPGDFVVLFLAGHGSNNKNGWVFAPHDFDPKNASKTLIWDTDLLEVADDLAARGHNVLLAVESCFSGSILTKAKEMKLVDVKRPLKKGRGGLVIATSSESGQSSIVGPVDETKVKTGWFSTALRESLSGTADGNRDGQVSVKELRDYLHARLYVISHTTITKLPGLEWPEQASVCLSSPEAPDQFGVAPGDRKSGRTGAQVKEGDFLPGSPILYPEKVVPAPGTWKVTKFNKIDTTKDEYTLTLATDKTYIARLKRPGSEEQETKGTYEWEADGELILKFVNGRDSFKPLGVTENTMNFLVQSEPFNHNDDIIELERVKK